MDASRTPTPESRSLKADAANPSSVLETAIIPLTEDEKMNARLVVAANISVENGLAEVLDMLGINKEEAHD